VYGTRPAQAGTKAAASCRPSSKVRSSKPKREDNRPNRLCRRSSLFCGSGSVQMPSQFVRNVQLSRMSIAVLARSRLGEQTGMHHDSRLETHPVVTLFSGTSFHRELLCGDFIRIVVRVQLEQTRQENLKTTSWPVQSSDAKPDAVLACRHTPVVSAKSRMGVLGTGVFVFSGAGSWRQTVTLSPQGIQVTYPSSHR
jgi:hypothetical protein